MTADEIIRHLQLAPLPGEGGFFRRTFTSPHAINWNGKERRSGTAIYYLVTPDEFSALHRLEQDELFHFYLGDPVEMVQITEPGDLSRHRLGPNILQGEQVQLLAPNKVWQGTRLVEGGKWALLGCTVVPGFDYADNVIGDRAELIARYPQHRDVIRYYTRERA